MDLWTGCGVDSSAILQENVGSVATNYGMHLRAKSTGSRQTPLSTGGPVAIVVGHRHVHCLTQHRFGFKARLKCPGSE